MNTRGLLIVSMIVIAACGDDSPSGGTDASLPDGSGPGAGARPLFQATTAPLGSGGLVALTQPAETVEVVALTLGSAPRLWRMRVGDATPVEVHQIVEAPAFDVDNTPSAVRDSTGALHVVWESSSRNVRYATDVSGAWTETTIAGGRGPSIALAVDGSPSVAYVSGTNAIVSRLDGDTWTPETIRSVGNTRAWTAIAGTGGPLVVAGTVGDGGLWLRRQEGGTWIDQPIDISGSLLNGVSANYALAAGSAGVLLGFASNLINYAAYLPAGASDLEIRKLGGNFEIYIDPRTSATVGSARIFIGGVDFGAQRLAVLAPGEPVWPLVAAVPWDADACSVTSAALGLDAADQPIVAGIACNGDLVVMQTVGAYPPEWDARCQEAITALCDKACDCLAAQGECGFTSSEGQNSGNRSGCELSAAETLCSNSTKPIEALTACLATFTTPSACVMDGYPLPDECASLRRIE